MDDRELLEMAALAAGIELKYDTFGNGPNADREYNYWNPLIDNADAFHLAVKLNLVVNKGIASIIQGDSFFELDAAYTGCPYAATRRAIVRAAAEIGKEMK